MKRRSALLLTVLVLCLALCLALPAAAESSNIYVYDLTGSHLTQDEGNALQDLAAEISGRHQCGVYLVIVDDYRDYGSSTRRAAESIYEDQGFGLYNDNSGILLLMSMGDRDYYVYHMGYGTYAMGLVSEDDFDAPMLAEFRNDNWYEGFEAYLNTCEDLLTYADGSYDPADYNSDGTLVAHRTPYGLCAVIGIGVGLLVALIVCSIGKAKMKSVHKGADAESYTVPNSMKLRVKSDRFTHRTETRTKIESSSSSRSGGGGRPSGGGGGHGGKF